MQNNINTSYPWWNPSNPPQTPFFYPSHSTATSNGRQFFNQQTGSDSSIPGDKAWQIGGTGTSKKREWKFISQPISYYTPEDALTTSLQEMSLDEEEGDKEGMDI